MFYMKPIVAIVGRPNVGKSALFNKLVGKRLSIVDDMPGVTRDRLYAECEWAGVEFLLVDTGGIEPSSGDLFMNEIKEQAQIAIDHSDIVILVTDVRTGLTQADFEVGRLLRRAKKKVLPVCNKCDAVGIRDFNVYDFYSLGFGNPVEISALHGTGTGEILDYIAENISESDGKDDCGFTKICVIGRPNAGKSSLVNKILNQNRVIVSDVPGTTRDSVDSFFAVGGKNYSIIDTAGIRRKSKINENVEYYSSLRTSLSVDRADVVVVLIDSSEGITEQDVKIAAMAHEKGKCSLVVFNKWDLVVKDTATQSKMKKQLYERLAFMPYVPVSFISAKTGYRVDNILTLCDEVFEQTNRRVTTGAVNDCINEAVIKAQPPSKKGRRLKIYYASQVSTAPPVFVIFVNDKNLMHFSYLRYIENRIRETFRFSGTPLRFIVRNKNYDKGSSERRVN